MILRISLYGKLGDSIGREVCHEQISAGCTVGRLRRELAQLYPAVAEDLLSPRVRACVNGKMSGEDCVIDPGDDVALLPPVSGG